MYLCKDPNISTGVMQCFKEEEETSSACMQSKAGMLEPPSITEWRSSMDEVGFQPFPVKAKSFAVYLTKSHLPGQDVPMQHHHRTRGMVRIKSHAFISLPSFLHSFLPSSRPPRRHITPRHNGLLAPTYRPVTHIYAYSRISCPNGSMVSSIVSSVH